MGWLKMASHPLVLRVARRVSVPVEDQRLGKVLGRARIVAFLGKMHVIRLHVSRPCNRRSCRKDA